MIWKVFKEYTLFKACFGGTTMKSRVCVGFLLGLLLFGLLATVQAGNKELMVVFTTDTAAELKPCG
jgi:hypothetical protein